MLVKGDMTRRLIISSLLFVFNQLSIHLLNLDFNLLLIFKLTFIMSTKINIIALQTIYGANAAIVASICEATANPTAALEIALDIYEQPAISKFGIDDNGNSLSVIHVKPMNEDYQVIRYERATDCVRYFRDEKHAKSNGTYERGGISEPTESYPYRHAFTAIDNGNCSFEQWAKYEANWAAANTRKTVEQRQADEFDVMYPQHEGNNDAL